MATETRSRNGARAIQNDPLLAARTKVPRPRFPVLARPRVDALLTDAVRSRVTLVHAIAGAGKTTACASWATTAGADVAWLTVDAADDLCTAIRAALARTGARWTTGLPAGPVGGSVSAFAGGVAAAVAGARRPVVLVLDGVDRLDAARLAPLAQLIEHAPAPLRFVLIGRRRPALRLARLRVSGDLATVGGPALDCDLAELTAYAERSGAAAHPRDLLARTGGWFAAARLWPGGRDLPLELAEYIEDEVLGDRTADVAAFLARVSVLDRCTEDLAAELTAHPYAADLAATLTADGLLLADGPWLRCRPPLAAALARPPHGVRPETRDELLATAAAWYTAHAEPLEAVRVAVRATEPHTASRLLLTTTLPAILAAGPTAVESVLDTTPGPAAPHDPAGPHHTGGDHSAAGHHGTAGSYATPGSHAGPGPHGAAGPHGASGPHGAAGPQGAAAAYALARAATRLFSGDAVAARRHLSAASEAADDPLVRVKGAALGLVLSDEAEADAGAPMPGVGAADGEYAYFAGLRRLREGAFRSAAAAFGSAAELLPGVPELAVRARAWAALALAWQGDLRDAEHQLSACPAGARAWPLPAARAWIHLERDDPRAAATALGDRPDGHIAVPGEPDAGVLGGIVQARVHVARGDLAAARTALGAGPGHGYLAGLRDTVAVELAQRAGDTALARELTERLPDGAEQRVLQGRVLLQDDQPRAALAAVTTLLDPPEATLGAVQRIGALAVAAAAYGRLRASEDAARLLAEALALAAAEAAYGALLACGQPLRALVTTVKPDDAEHDRVRRELLRRFDLRPVVPPRATVDEEPLTRAELSVLRFLSSHLTNTEIAESLVVSVNTVKTHLRSIYRKLGVSTRRDAIRAADRLGLL